MKIAVGSDHAGFEAPPPFYKPALIDYLKAKGHTVVDCGTNGPDSVDYPDIAGAVCSSVLQGEAERGVLICGTGVGVSIAANRHPGIRAAACTSPYLAELSRSHNDANVLCLGRRVLTLEECFAILDVWMSTAFSDGERHRRRVEKLG